MSSPVPRASITVAIPATIRALIVIAPYFGRLGAVRHDHFLFRRLRIQVVFVSNREWCVQLPTACKILLNVERERRLPRQLLCHSVPKRQILALEDRSFAEATRWRA